MVWASLVPGISVRALLCLLGPRRAGRHISAHVRPPGRRRCLDRDKQVGQGTGMSCQVKAEVQPSALRPYWLPLVDKCPFPSLFSD